LRYFTSSPQIIRLKVMIYVPFPLSLRNVEALLAERGIDKGELGQSVTGCDQTASTCAVSCVCTMGITNYPVEIWQPQNSISGPFLSAEYKRSG